MKLSFAIALISISLNTNAQIKIYGNVEGMLPEREEQFPSSVVITVHNVSSPDLTSANAIASTEKATEEKNQFDKLFKYNYRFELENRINGEINRELHVLHRPISEKQLDATPFPEGIDTQYEVTFKVNHNIVPPTQLVTYGLRLAIYDSQCSLQYGPELTDHRCLRYEIPLGGTPNYWDSASSLHQNVQPEKVYPMVKNKPRDAEPPLNLPKPVFPQCWTNDCPVP